MYQLPPVSPLITLCSHITPFLPQSATLATCPIHLPHSRQGRSVAEPSRPNLWPNSPQPVYLEHPAQNHQTHTHKPSHPNSWPKPPSACLFRDTSSEPVLTHQHTHPSHSLTQHSLCLSIPAPQLRPTTHPPTPSTASVQLQSDPQHSLPEGCAAGCTANRRLKYLLERRA